MNVATCWFRNVSGMGVAAAAILLAIAGQTATPILSNRWILFCNPGLPTR